MGINITPPETPEMVSILPKFISAANSLTIATSSLIVDFAALKISQK